MPFKYSCFVSYVHGEHGLMATFQRQLAETLTSSLEPYFKDQKPFIDRNQAPGVQVERSLADALCHSVCMVAVLVPTYESSEYCLREFRAMEILEKKRLRLLGTDAESRGLIIPIVLRGDKDRLPDRIKNHIHFYDLTGFTTVRRRISEAREFEKRIDSIASYIHKLHEDFKRTGVDFTECEAFALPPKNKCTPLISKRPQFPNRQNRG